MIEQQALDRVNKARAELILARRFYGVLVSNVTPGISRKFPTAATNGKQHLWNPEYVMKLTAAELLGVQAHESEHDARHHGTRRGSRDPVKWNEACDYAINPDLIKEGFTLPKKVLLDWKYEGLSAEDIYRSRELDEARQQKQQPEPEPEDEQDDEPEDEQGDEPEQDDGSEPQDSGSDEQDDGDEAGDEAGDEDGEAGGEDGEGEEGEEPGAGAGEGEGEGEGSGSGEGEGEGEGEGSGTGAGQGDGEPGESSGDPGGCGEVLDSVAEGEAGVAEDDAKWDRVVRQAVSMAKGVGQLPGYIAREIERANNPPREWRDELREFAEQGGLRIETWNRPNRRFSGRGFVLPSTQKDGVSKAAFLIDTSGSCDDIALACVQDEAQQLLDDGIIDEIVVVYGDTRVTRVDEYRTGDEIEFDPKGGGGTDMKPLFDFIAEEHDDCSLIVCFTDLEFYRPLGDEPDAPVLWAVHGYPQRVRQLMAKTPWDARAIDVGAH